MATVKTYDPKCYELDLREAALSNYYRAERRAGACALMANERMMEFAKRLDREEEERAAADNAFNRDLETIRQVMERTR